MSTLSIGGVTTGTVSFEMSGELAASRNLALMASAIAGVDRKAIGTLRRRLVVEARRDIQNEYNLKAGRISQDLSVRESAAGIVLRGAWRGIGLMNFGARQTRQGVTASVFKGQRSLRPSAFIAPMRNGNRQVAQRVGKSRLPIAVQYGATVAQMLRKGQRPERLAQYARGVLRAETERLLEAYAYPSSSS